MHRTQVIFEERQYEALKIRARHENRSLSEIVRLAVDKLLGIKHKKVYQLKDMCCLAKDPGGPSSRDHDKVLYGI